MCGIAGLIAPHHGPDPEILAAMAARLQSRGPDGEGCRVFGPVALIHRRLAIIDPVGGAQPLSNDDGTVWITFNGEVYNFRSLRDELTRSGHRFRTQSDTEVVVHAYQEWGTGCLERLRGMFAFAIWDATRHELFLARDRVGIKPLLYFQTKGLFAFASEMRAFEPLPAFHPRLDMLALDLYLQFQYIPAPFTVYQEVRKLPPAHYLVVREDGSTVGPTRYWDLVFQPDERVTEEEWLDRLDVAISDSVRAHLVSDVPFGAFLSGGVDSSTVVAYMGKHMREPVRTFTIGFDHPDYDETAHARAVAARVGTTHHEERVEPDALAVLPELVEHYGEPFADSSAVPTYHVSRLAARHVKMVLSGDGGDENFAGYPTYPRALQTLASQAPRGTYRRARHALANVARDVGIWPALPSRMDPGQAWRETVAYFPDPERLRLWRPEFRGLVEASRGWFDAVYNRVSAPDMCSRLQKLDIETYLPFDILTKVDVASMCHGLEVRVPLLDHELMELLAQMPSRLKLRVRNPLFPAERGGSEGKYILKRLAERYFDGATLRRPKMGFSAPLGEWFRGPLRSHLQERLVGSESSLGEYLEPGEVVRLIEANDRDACHGFRLWALLFLAEWLQRNRSRLW